MPINLTVLNALSWGKLDIALEPKIKLKQVILLSLRTVLATE